ncbi:MAG: 1-phosphofructokinase family hexose kinase [Candidatus Sericytochromatia bacterium]|nr:1-phosphofructokinase family hexose kinase [Candidatus Sericytochromatia bacterium]
MYLTVTLNPALDKLHAVPHFTQGIVNTPTETTIMPGGKGINVARQLYRLGEKVRATGLVGGFTGKAIMAGLDEEGIPYNFVDVAGESRVCGALYDPMTGITTEINEIGPQINADQWAQFTRRFSHHLADAANVVCAGRLPPGVPDDAYAELIDLAQRDGKLIALDTVEPALRLGLQAGPTIAKPNQDEAEALLGYSLAERDSWRPALDALLSFGLEAAAVTLGAGGAIVGVRNGEQRYWYLKALDVKVVSTIGCGDAFLGAWLSAHGRGLPWHEAAVPAMAAGAANGMYYGSGIALPDQIKTLISQVVLSPL